MNTKGKREKILKHLQTYGKLNSYSATFVYGFGKQAPARIRELKNLGYDIVSLSTDNKSVDWVLRENSVRTTQKHLDPQTMHFCGNTARFYAQAECKYCQPVQEALV